MARKQLPKQPNLPPRDPRRYMLSGTPRNGPTYTIQPWQEEAAEGYRPKRLGTPTVANPVYKAHFPEMVYQLRLLGATKRMIAAACNTTENTIYHWCHGKGKDRIPEFAEAMEAGGQLADARMAMATFHRGIGYSHPDEKIMVVEGKIERVPTTKHYPPDTTAAVFWLTNRQRALWKSRTSTELTGEDGQPLLPPQLVIQAVDSE